MSEQGNAAIRAGQVAQSQGMWLHNQSRFIDPWKEAAGKIARGAVDLNRRAVETGQGAHRRGGPVQPYGSKKTRLLETLADWTVGKRDKRGNIVRPGPASGRESARWHTPQEFQDPFDQQLQRGQQQPFERAPEQSSGGNLSQEQFGGEGDGRFGDGPWGRPGSQPL